MRLTERIKTGSQWFTVELFPFAKGMMDACADVCFATQTIRIADTHFEQQRGNLMHEVVHVILGKAGFNKESDNEQLVCAIASGLCAVLADNPDFAKLFFTDRPETRMDK